MYQYKSAIGRLKGYNKRWLAVDVSTKTINYLVNNYYDIWFTLHESTRNIDVCVKLSDLIQHYSDSKLTVLNFLIQVGNLTLPESVSPVFSTKVVKYKHAIRAGFDIKLANILRLNDSSIANIDKPDVVLTRPDTSYNDLRKVCLATINGFLHRTDSGTKGFYIVDGATSSRVANETEVGLYSFKDIGELTQIPITANMIYTPNPGDRLANGAYLKLPSAIGNKIPILVIGGYLHALDSIYSIVSDNVIKVNMLKLNFIQRYLESRHYLDLSSIELTKSDVSPGTISQDELFSDANIKAYLTLSQSFIVLVDTPHLYALTKYTSHSDISGRAEHPSYPTTPLRGNLGRLVEYWVREERERFVLCFNPHHRKRYHMETTPYESLKLFDDGQDTIKPFDVERLTMLEIGRDF